MDNLVLIRVAASLRASLVGSVVDDLREEGRRLRLRFLLDERPRSALVSFDPANPWLARPVTRAPRHSAASGAFAAVCRRRLRGVVLAAIDKPPADRTVSLRFADGQRLILELTPGRANVVLVDATGNVVGAARRPRRSRRRLDRGRPYAPAALPDRLDPFVADAAALDRHVRSGAREGRGAAAALFRGCVGMSRAAADLVVEESRASGQTVGTVLTRRLQATLAGKADPVLIAPASPLEAAERGELDPETCRLLPWPPVEPPEPPLELIREHDPAATAGLFHEAADIARAEALRTRALRSALSGEITRIRQAQERVAGDVRRFRNPERFRHWAEALLAGLRDARRAGDHVLVPDPYEGDRRLLSIPVEAGTSPRRAAERFFDRHRRSSRGLEQARSRGERLAERRLRLERLLKAHEGSASREANDRLLRSMQSEGIPVGLEAPGPGAGRGAGAGVRVEGVRLFRSTDGAAILAGKSGPDNHRLTFKLASPEDFWLHALGVAGAHVVLRNDGRRGRPPEGALSEAAAIAAWYSAARRDGRVEVMWTRRKYVRQVRGAPPGTVTVKKFETLRVRPQLPAAETV